MNAGDRWAMARAEGRERADGLAVGSRLTYALADELGEQTMAELRRALSERRLTLLDDGDGLVVVAI